MEKIDDEREVTKEIILKSLNNHRDTIDRIINSFESLDVSNKRVNRNLVNNIVFGLFELIDTITNTEVDIYNYMKRRDDGLFVK